MWDSGDMFERLSQPTLDGTLTLFNTTNTANSRDNRSDDKGIEPESVVVGKVDGRPYAFVGLERDSGIVVLDLSIGAAPTIASYFTNRKLPRNPATGAFLPCDDTNNCGDLGPEGLTFVPAATQPDRQSAADGVERSQQHHHDLAGPVIGYIGGGAVHATESPPLPFSYRWPCRLSPRKRGAAGKCSGKSGSTSSSRCCRARCATHGIDMWIVAVKENHYDPLWNDLGRGYVSGIGYYVFTDRGGDRIERAALGPSGYLLNESGAYDIFAPASTLAAYVKAARSEAHRPQHVRRDRSRRRPVGDDARAS